LRWLKRNKKTVWAFLAFCWGVACLHEYGLFKGMLLFGCSIIVAPLFLIAIFPGLLVARIVLPFLLWLVPLNAIVSHGGLIGGCCYLLYPLVLYTLLAGKKQKLVQAQEISESKVQETMNSIIERQRYFSPGARKARGNEPMDETEHEKLRTEAISLIQSRAIGSLWDDKEFRLLLLIPPICAILFFSRDIFPFLPVVLKGLIDLILSPIRQGSY